MGTEGALATPMASVEGLNRAAVPDSDTTVGMAEGKASPMAIAIKMAEAAAMETYTHLVAGLGLDMADSMAIGVHGV